MFIKSFESCRGLQLSAVAAVETYNRATYNVIMRRTAR